MFIVQEKIEDQLFDSRAKKAKDLIEKNNYIEAIKYDNVDESNIYLYFKYYIKNNISINYDDKKIKTMIFGLNDDHLKEFTNINSLFIPESKLKLFKDTLLHIFEVFDSYNENYACFNELIKYCDSINNKILSYINEDQGEFILNQPVTFNNNPNYIYIYILYLYVIELKNLCNDKSKFDEAKMKIYSIEYLKQFIEKFEKYSDAKKWNILFYLISACRTINYKHKTIINKLNDEKDEENIKLNFKIEKLEDENNISEIIKDNFIPSLFNKVKVNLKKLINIYDIYNSQVLLSCIKIESLNKHNFYTPDLELLKTIIFDIINSNAIKDYIKEYLGYSVDMHFFENKIFYNLIWDEYVTFVEYENEDFYAKTFRIFSRIFLSSFPLVEMEMDNKFYRLFNYALFIIICVHEFIGHLEKMFYSFINQNISPKTPNNLIIDFAVDNSDDFKKEKEFLLNKYKVKIDELIKRRNLDKRNYSVKKDKKEKDKEKNDKENYKFENSNNQLDENEYIERNEFEGGFNMEKMIFGLIVNSKIMTINQVLFILNKNNYLNLKNTRRYCSLYFSYEKSYIDEKDYIQQKNFSYELSKILSNLDIKENELLELDKYLIEKYFLNELITNDMFIEKDSEKIRKQYKNIFRKKQKKRKIIGCIKRLD